MRIGRQLQAGLAVLASAGALLALGAETAAASGLPQVTTGAASGVSQTVATVNGSVNPGGVSIEACSFEYGPEPGFYFYETACTQALPLTGESPVSVSAALTGLANGTNYHYRLVASGGGETFAGEDEEFTTLPAVEGLQTLAATAVGPREATLNGTLEPNGSDVHYRFEYGTSEEYGSTTPLLDAGSTHEAKAIAAALTGLVPSQIYHYRLLGEDSAGTTYGQDMSFSTVALAPALEAGTTSVTRSNALIGFHLSTNNAPTEYWVQYGIGQSYGQVSARTLLPASGVTEAPSLYLEDLSPGTTYHYQLLASNATGEVSSSDETFTTAPATPPLVQTGPVSALSENSATISGVVGAQGEPTTYGFEVAAGGEFGSPAAQWSVGGGEETASLVLSGLQPGTTYRYRMVASNLDGTTYGAPVTFTTAGSAVALAVPPAPTLIATSAVAFPSPSATPSRKVVAPKQRKKKPKKTNKRAGKHKAKKQHKNAR